MELAPGTVYLWEGLEKNKTTREETKGAMGCLGGLAGLCSHDNQLCH